MATTVNGIWVNKSQYDDAEKRLQSKESSGAGGLNKKAKKPAEPKVEALATAIAAAPAPQTQQPEKAGSTKKKNKKNKNKANNAGVEEKPVLATVQVVEVLKKEPVNAKDKKNLNNEFEKVKEPSSSTAVLPDQVEGLAGVSGNSELSGRLAAVEAENKKLHQVVDGLQKLVISLGDRLKSLETKCGGGVTTCPKPAAAPAKAPAPAKAAAEDDDVDLFGSDDEESEEAAAVREKRLAEYAAKKSKKPALIAKSNIIFDIKPWDDETDMKAVEEAVRKIQCDGLLFGVSKLVPLAYGIHKLQITCVVEDDKVSIDWLQEEIEKNEDLVQSVDIAAFNKI